MAEKITLEEKLRQKLASGEIDQEEYDSMMKKFEDLDLLKSSVGSGSPSYSFSGSKTMKGGQINEPVKVSGRLNVTESLICPKFYVSGAASIDGSLTVTGPIKVSGSLSIGDDAKFGNVFKLSGKTIVRKSLFITGETSVSGKLNVEDRIVSDSFMKVSGGVTARSFQSTSLLKLSGRVEINEDLKAERFITSGGSSRIGGNLVADYIEIAKKYREKISGIESDIETEMGSEDFHSASSLGKFVSSMVTSFIPKIISNFSGTGHMRPPRIFQVVGDVKGSSVDISYTNVKGDVIGDDIIVGPEVTIEGTIRYKNSITVPEGAEYNIEQQV